MTPQTKKIAIGAGIFVAVLLSIGAVGIAIKPQELPVNANWVLVSEADDGGRWYVDPATVEYEGSQYAQAWVLLANYKGEDSKTHSLKFKTLFDCAGHRYRFMETIGMEGVNGRGAVTQMHPADPAQNVPPSSNISLVSDYVCKPTNPATTSDSHEHKHESVKEI